MASALGVSVIDYLPFTFFLYISPMISILLGFLKKLTIRENLPFFTGRFSYAKIPLKNGICLKCLLNEFVSDKRYF